MKGYNKVPTTRFDDFAKDTVDQYKVKLTIDKMKKVFQKTGVDFGTLDKDASIEYIKKMKLQGAESFLNTLPTMKAYQSWCYERGYRSSEPPFLDVPIKNIIEVCMDKKASFVNLMSREEVLKFINRMNNPRDAFVTLAIFEGLGSGSVNNILLLSPDSIKENGFEIPERGFVPASERLVELAKKSAEISWYYPMTATGSYSDARLLYNNGTIVKDTSQGKSLDNFVTRFYNRYARTLSLMGGKYSPTAHMFESSGIVEMVLKEAKNHGMPPMVYLKTPLLEDVEKQYGKKIDPNRLAYKYRDYLV